ncbi:RidA family protein [Ammoniphilus sp. YIM 78166]|uniref:RidA family protein n=1 Tax=Ammoniphilus sp. YIM 78166 TaxID=1644106 RepID=UPI00106F9CA0|nr:RidA family protein [Ammoniphilus sp. YIM 78166]
MAKREVIEIPGVTHGKAPIPMGAKIGSIVYSSAIMGKDARTDELPEDAESQFQFLFRNIKAFMEAAGGSTDQIIRMSVYLKDNSYRELFNQEWLRMFPNPHDRPARHISLADLNRGMCAQVEIIAVLY